MLNVSLESSRPKVRRWSFLLLLLCVCPGWNLILSLAKQIISCDSSGFTGNCTWWQKYCKNRQAENYTQIGNLCSYPYRTMLQKWKARNYKRKEIIKLLIATKLLEICLKTVFENSVKKVYSGSVFDCMWRGKRDWLHLIKP